ncbi:hypothetical protein AB9R05_09760, partial [Neisseria gonorrhoeae]
TDPNVKQKRLSQKKATLDKYNQELAELGENEKKKEELEKKVKQQENKIQIRKRHIERLKEDIEKVAVLEEEIKRSEKFFDENGWLKDSIIDDKTKKRRQPQNEQRRALDGYQ